MTRFKIPDLLAPLWSDPSAKPQPINDQVGDLVDTFAASGNNSAIFALMQGLSIIDRAGVHDRTTDPREWALASDALRQAHQESNGEPPKSERLLSLLIDQIGRAERELAEEPESFKGDRALHRVAKTHQRDRLHATQWDAERCVAASVVAALGLGGDEPLTTLANEVKRTLGDERARYARALATAPSPDRPDKADLATRLAAQADVLPSLTVLINALELRPAILLERHWWNPSKSQGSESLPGVLLDPTHPERGFWLRDSTGRTHHVGPAVNTTPTGSALVVKDGVTAPEGLTLYQPPSGTDIDAGWLQRIAVAETTIAAEVYAVTRQHDPRASAPQGAEAEPRWSVGTQSVAVDPRVASVMLALAQITQTEPIVYEDALGIVDSEIARIDDVLAKLEVGSPLPTEALQVLADTLLFATRTVANGTNHLPMEALLGRAGFAATPPEDGVARTVPELTARSQPGEAWFAAGNGHAVAYLHLVDGRRLIYDSEGIFHIGERDCLATYDPQDAPRRSEALARHYGEFFGILRLPLTRGRPSS